MILIMFCQALQTVRAIDTNQVRHYHGELFFKEKQSNNSRIHINSGHGSGMNIVKENDSVTITFTGKLDNGAVFIEIPVTQPMKITLGDSELPPTVEMAVIGMQKGESKKVRVSPDEGYGPRLKDLLHEVPRTTFGDRIEPKPGMVLSQKVEKDGVEQKIPVTIIEVKEDVVVLDYNHPLAGHHLTYDVTIVGID
jgi:FKBP-type peptidyl-prolyl cis-trans isomerase 2